MLFPSIRSLQEISLRFAYDKSNQENHPNLIVNRKELLINKKGKSRVLRRRLQNSSRRNIRKMHYPIAS